MTTEKFWDKYAPIYDMIMSKESKNDELFTYIRQYLNKENILLDVACGTGLFTINLSKDVKEVHSFDYSEEMIKITQKKIQELHLNNIHTSIQDITNLNYEDDKFNVVIAANIIHLFNKPENVLKELQRVTKDNGIIILPTYTIGRKFDKIKIKFMKIFGFNSNEWTPDEYINILENNNLDIIDDKVLESGQTTCIVIIKNNK